MIQIGPKIQLGGENGGFCKVWYQVGMLETVKGVAAIPTNSHPIVAIKNFKSLFIFNLSKAKISSFAYYSVYS